MRISDWSSDVCSSDLKTPPSVFLMPMSFAALLGGLMTLVGTSPNIIVSRVREDMLGKPFGRSEEHTSELQSLMRISYAVFCLKKKKKQTTNNKHKITK